MIPSKWICNLNQGWMLVVFSSSSLLFVLRQNTSDWDTEFIMDPWNWLEEQIQIYYAGFIHEIHTNTHTHANAMLLNEVLQDCISQRGRKIKIPLFWCLYTAFHCYKKQWKSILTGNLGLRTLFPSTVFLFLYITWVV